MSFAEILALAIATFVFVVSPGPGIIALLSRTLSRGIAAGLLLGVGLIMGDLIYLIAILASFYSLADIVAPYMDYVRVFGALFLAYVGYKQWGAPPLGVSKDQQERDRNILETFAAGIAISSTNPKVMVFYLSFLPQFMDLTKLTLSDSVLVVITISLSLFAGCLLYTIGADQLFRLIKSEEGARRVNKATGAAIIAVAIAMVATI